MHVEQVREMSKASVIVSLSFPLDPKTATLETIIQNSETPISFQIFSSLLTTMSAYSTVKLPIQIKEQNI